MALAVEKRSPSRSRSAVSVAGGSAELLSVRRPAAVARAFEGRLRRVHMSSLGGRRLLGKWLRRGLVLGSDPLQQEDTLIQQL
jgi:hypothetical protein